MQYSVGNVDGQAVQWTPTPPGPLRALMPTPTKISNTCALMLGCESRTKFMK